MKNRLSDSSGYKTYVVSVGDTEYLASVRRLPLRPLDNESRYRVRLITRVAGVETANVYRDMDISKAFRVYDQNVFRLAALVA